MNKFDYYPFGMVMPGRKYSAGTGYRYGFNGKENDNEVKGEGNQQDYGMRIYDTRLGKFLSNDPLSKTFPYYSPYHFAGCNPIRNVDLDGGEPKDFMKNWVAMTLADAKTGVEALSATDMFGKNYRVVFDKVTQKAWFIHEGNNGQYEYWQHNPGENEMQYRISNSGKTDNGQWKSFETADAAYAKEFQKSHDRLTAGFIIGIASAPAAILAGIPTLATFSTASLSTRAGAVATDYSAQVVGNAVSGKGWESFTDINGTSLLVSGINPSNSFKSIVGNNLISNVYSFSTQTMSYNGVGGGKSLETALFETGASVLFEGSAKLRTNRLIPEQNKVLKFQSLMTEAGFPATFKYQKLATQRLGQIQGSMNRTGFTGSSAGNAAENIVNPQ